MKKKIAALLAAMILSLAAALGAMVFSFADGRTSTGDASVFFRTDGEEEQFSESESSPSSEIILYPDQGEGLGAPGAVIRLFNPNAYAVYDFDLDDGVQTAYLSVVGGSFEVAYKTDADAEYIAFDRQAAVMAYGVMTYELNADNALKGADRTFKIKLTNREGGQIRLFAIAVCSSQNVVADAVSFGGNTVNTAEYIVNSNGAGVYFGGAAEKGMLYMKPEKSVTFGFYVDPQSAAKISFSAELGWNGNATGNSPYIESSADNQTFTAYVAGTPMEAGSGKMYFRVTNGAGGADLIISNLSLGTIAPTIASGENKNTAVPANVEEGYFKVGSDDEKAYMFGSEDDFEQSFNATHAGMVVDGHEGGSAAMTVPNARRLTAGQYVAYDFDFADTVRTGKIKVWAQAGLSAKVSTDNGETYTDLTAAGTPSARGLYIFDLTEEDAFAGAENRFRLVLQAAGESYLFAVNAHADEVAAAKVTEGVSLRPLSRESFRYLIQTNGVASYYSMGVEEGRGYFFNSTESIAVFKIPFAANVQSTAFYVNQCANVKIELSDDGESYTAVVDNLLGGTGEVPYNTFDASSYLGENGTIWVRVTGNAGGGFIFDMGFSGEPVNQSSGVVDSDNFGKYLVSVSNGNGIGQLLRIGGSALGADGLIWKLTGDAVFRLDLNDDAAGLQLTVQGIAAVTASIYVSADGENWTMVGTADNAEKSFLNYNALKNNESKRVYVKFSSAEYYMNGFSFTTEGIAPEGDKSKPYDDADVDFNYDGNVPGVDSYDKTVLPAPEIPDGEVVSAGGCGGNVLFANGAIGFAFAIILTGAAVAVFCKKRGTKE